MEKSLQEEAQKTKIIIMRRNNKCTRGHKRSVYKYSLHVNNRKIVTRKNKIKLLLVVSQ